MAMTLRLPPEEADALRRFADLTEHSMQEVVRMAIREYIDDRSHRMLLNKVLDEDLPGFAEALDRLGR